jgi:serine/threonine protein kinase
VAIKVLPAERMADEERRRRFLQEARSASALSHPNIVTIHEIETVEGVDFIVMEYVAGQTLDAVTAAARPAPCSRRRSPTSSRSTPRTGGGSRSSPAGRAAISRNRPSGWPTSTARTRPA